MTMILDGTNGETFPTWTTGTRPASPSVAQVGWNTTIGSLENYNGTAWTAVGGGGAGSWQSVQASNFAATSGNAYAVNTTSSAITVTLPASPSVGNYIQLVDYAGTWGTNAVTINPNGLKINASTSNVILNVNRQAAAIVYIDSTQGWICYSQGASIGPYPVNYLIVAGGGGGAGANGGGGAGAGGLLSATYSLTPAVSYSIVVGAGGAGTNDNGTNGVSGSNSSAFTLSSIGGGGGGKVNSPGLSGGSGGGAGRDASGGTGGTGTSGQGYAGGTTPGGAYSAASGGGGAAAVGGNGSGTGGGPVDSGPGGNGGIGVSSSINGTATYYAGGGGGSAVGNTGGSGGSGGGGAGGNNTGGTNGTANLGGGGGGGRNAGGGNGGSGIVIISYSGAQRGTGGTITSSGGNTIHTFTSSGTYTA